MPELVVSVQSALAGQSGRAVGNVVGSKIYNLLCILGSVGLIAPIYVGGVAWTDMGGVIGMSILLIPILWSGFMIRRVEGVVLLLIYGCYLAWLLLK
jgi:cation:H+ antiporter